MEGCGMILGKMEEAKVLVEAAAAAAAAGSTSRSRAPRPSNAVR
jgi:hypothetical protein